LRLRALTTSTTNAAFAFRARWLFCDAKDREDREADPEAAERTDAS
jgi:hypothetical protein